MLKRRTLVLALIAAVCAAPLFATTVVLLDESQLVSGAERIVHGDVVSKRSYVAAVGGRIYTEYRFQPREMLKGAADGDGFVTFREWGGEVNGLHYYIPGVGEFRTGEEVVAFLGEADPRTGVGFTTGLSQGKFRVAREGGTARVRRDVTGARLLDRTGAEAPTPPADAGDLDAFKAAIKAQVGK